MSYRIYTYAKFLKDLKVCERLTYLSYGDLELNITVCKHSSKHCMWYTIPGYHAKRHTKLAGDERDGSFLKEN